MRQIIENRFFMNILAAAGVWTAGWFLKPFTMESHPELHHWQVLFLCGEYHAFATVGLSGPTGDEKFFSLSR